MAGIAGLGFSLFYGTVLFRDRPLLGRLYDHLLDERWPWRLDGLQFSPRPGATKAPGKKRLSPKHREELLDVLGGEDVCLAAAYHRRDDGWAYASLDLGQYPKEWDGEYPFNAWGWVGASDGSAEPWIAWVCELAGLLGAIGGILSAWDTRDKVMSDASMVLVNDALPDPFGRQASSAMSFRREIGRRARHPRWGTFLSRSLLAQIGGLDAVEASVRPARVRELADLVYIQLSDSPRDPAEDKRGRLESLMDPILLPLRR